MSASSLYSSPIKLKHTEQIVKGSDGSQVLVAKDTFKDPPKDPTKRKPFITPGFFKEYMPFIVFIILALILLISIIFIPARTITKLFAASTGIAWTSFWATVIYLLCLGGNTFLAWFVMFIPLLLWLVITVMVFIGAIKLDSNNTQSII